MYRGSDEFNRILGMIKEMAHLKGKMVLGASWELPCHYGRGETRAQLLAKKKDPTTSATSFAMNYESKWVKKHIAYYKSSEPTNVGCELLLVC